MTELKMFTKFSLTVLQLFNILNMTNALHPKLLLISFDGFRWNYLSRTSTPNFDRLIKEGSKAQWITDLFVSQTFPNHYSIVTGLYEESHGIVSNRFYDPKLDKIFDYHTSTVQDPAFWFGEPIWITNQRQGGKTGVFYWVGSEQRTRYPTIWKKFPKKIKDRTPWVARVDTVVSWLANKPTNDTPTPLDINLSLLYFAQPDHFGHTYGPESKEVTNMIKQCDNITGYLIKKLEDNDLFDKVNIIITSDHGMAELNQTKMVPILPHINIKNVHVLLNYGTGAGVWPKEGYTDSIYDGLFNISDKVQVWKREDIPDSLHYKNNDRIPPVLLMPRDGWWLTNNTDDKLPMKGSHGYNNSLTDMHPFFIAHGPSFRKGYKSKPFSSLDIYGLICHLIGIKPSPNNGSFVIIQNLLVKTEQPSHYNIATTIGIIVGSVMTLFVLMYIARFFSVGNRNPDYSRMEGHTEALIPIATKA